MLRSSSQKDSIQRETTTTTATTNWEWTRQFVSRSYKMIHRECVLLKFFVCLCVMEQGHPPLVIWSWTFVFVSLTAWFVIYFYIYKPRKDRVWKNFCSLLFNSLLL
jgi:hypothetical protein